MPPRQPSPGAFIKAERRKQIDGLQEQVETEAQKQGQTQMLFIGENSGNAHKYEPDVAKNEMS